ncbi:hypothetical protein D3874_10220 [Oleomonas cavernae]|uniref:Uncharacterized protein n=1 Tax=Oleomonas cavernae TaxID=2320859 RepID=A0A418WBK4_9PROT|nr:hypothetical protein [Oleomonas cavernae]RJF87354.1 hypothetical protein D3874_10220 [Oleomonas cavernae]
MQSSLDLWPWALGAVLAFAAAVGGLRWRARRLREHLPRITAAIDGETPPDEFEIDITIQNIFSRPIRLEQVRVDRPKATLITDVLEWVTGPEGRSHRPRFVTDKISSMAIVPAAEPGFDGTLRQAIWARPPAGWNRKELVLRFAVTVTDPVSHTHWLTVSVDMPELWGGAGES